MIVFVDQVIGMEQLVSFAQQIQIGMEKLAFHVMEVEFGIP